MKIRIDLREPGNIHTIWEGEMSAVPREGEHITLDIDDAGYTVHSVGYVAPEDLAILLVRR